MPTLLFDLDNTLYVEARVGMLAAMATRMEEFIMERLGLSLEDARAFRLRALGQYGNTLAGLIAERDVEPRDFLDYIHYAKADEYLQPDPRLDEMLASIESPKIIFSNGPRNHAEGVLERLGVAQRFPRVIAIEDLDYCPKPQPSAYEVALEAAGVPAEECWFIDDVPNNLVPARQMGMKTVLVNRAGSHPVDHHLQSIYDLVDEVLTPNGIR